MSEYAKALAIRERNPERYADMVTRMREPFDCEYGHDSCALVPSGPCLDEGLSTVDDD